MGAGISTNAGIPDYRSTTGIFTQMKHKYGMSQPEDLFTPQYFNRIQTDPIYQKFILSIKQAKPTIGHLFCVWLHEKGWLRRVYTQNTDGLHQAAGLPNDMVVEYHGSLLQNDVLLYGDEIKQSTIDSVITDFVTPVKPVDLLIVLGSSLQVSSFCALPNLVTKACPRVLVDLYPSNAMTNSWSKLPVNYDDVGHSGISSKSHTTFRSGRRRINVTLRSLWARKDACGQCSKYKEQYIIVGDIDDWASSIMRHGDER